MSSNLKEIVQVVKVVDKIEQRKESRLKPRTKVNHMNTRTTKQIMEISNNAEKQLSLIGKEIIELLGKNTLEEIREKLKQKVGSVISNAVRESYLLGFHFIESFKDRTIELTAQHVKEINKEIDEQINAFWDSISKIVGDTIKPNGKIFGAAGPADLLLLDLFNKSFSRSSISFSFFALNQGTINTQRQVFKEEIKISKGGKSSKIIVTGKIKVPQSIWVSERDSRVCIICLNLDGRVWDVDDNTMPRPVRDSHIGCRCRLLPIDPGTSKVFNA